MTMAHFHPFFLPFLLFFLFVVVLSDPGRCRLPNGSSPAVAASCGQADLCCKSGDLCLINGLCATQGMGGYHFYYRGACRDPAWEDPGCPRFCRDPGQDDQWLGVYRCPNDDTHRLWYCGGGPPGNTCEAPGSYFELSDIMDPFATAGSKPDPSSVTRSAEESPTTTGDSPGGSTGDQSTPSMTTAPDPVQPSLGQPPVDTSATPNPAPPSETASESSPTTPSASASHPPPPPANTAATPAPSRTPGQDAAGPGSSTGSPTGTPQDDVKSNPAVPIGVGVAVGASVLIAASVLVFFYQRKRHRQAPIRAETPPPFEFAFINNHQQNWLGPSYGTKLPEMHGDDGNRDVPGAGAARAELP